LAVGVSRLQMRVICAERVAPLDIPVGGYHIPQTKSLISTTRVRF
uniref:Protein kinase domain-containing protein n=1 Tax=Parascaris univalens TaxID=6257 RepID=A0A915C8F1_PARUN